MGEQVTTGLRRPMMSLVLHRRLVVIHLRLLLVILLVDVRVVDGARIKNPQVLIKGVTVIGKEISISRTQRATAFLGIPYASPPVGDLRFSPPEKISWPSDVDRPLFNATTFRPSCHQVTQNIEKAMGRYLFNLLVKQPGVNVSHQKEDCLYLNIYVPEGRPPMDSGGWPVVIWFHPGDFSSGTPILWDPTAFVIKQKVIVVSPSYRLDIFGFMSLENDDIPGNFGLMDQVAAMDWVHDHIGLFNGSRNDVMIWGHSAGGTSVTLHLVSEQSAKKFHKAVAMSGNVFLPDSIVQPRRNTIVNYFLKQEYGCTREKIEDCLRNLDVTALKKASEELPEELGEEYGPWIWGPVIDGYFVEDNPFLRDDPKEMFKTKRIHKVPLMAGFTDMEDIDTSDLDNFPVNKKTFTDSVSKVFYDELHLEALKILGNDSGCALNEDFIVNSILFHYTPSSPEMNEDQSLFRKRYIELATDRKFGAGTYALGEAMSSTDSFTYLYRFDYKMKSTGMSVNREWVGVPHQYDLPIFWGMPYWTTINPPIIWNNIDKKTSDVVMGLLGNFTRYSIPIQNKKTTTTWERFTSINPRLLIMDKTFNMSDSSSFDYKSVLFWNEYYPLIIESVSNCCNSTATLGVSEVQPLLITSILFYYSLSLFTAVTISHRTCSDLNIFTDR